MYPDLLAKNLTLTQELHNASSEDEFGHAALVYQKMPFALDIYHYPQTQGEDLRYAFHWPAFDNCKTITTVFQDIDQGTQTLYTCEGLESPGHVGSGQPDLEPALVKGSGFLRAATEDFVLAWQAEQGVDQPSARMTLRSSDSSLLTEEWFRQVMHVTLPEGLDIDLYTEAFQQGFRRQAVRLRAQRQDLAADINVALKNHQERILTGFQGKLVDRHLSFGDVRIGRLLATGWLGMRALATYVSTVQEGEGQHCWVLDEPNRFSGHQVIASTVGETVVQGWHQLQELSPLEYYDPARGLSLLRANRLLERIGIAGLADQRSAGYAKRAVWFPAKGTL